MKVIVTVTEQQQVQIVYAAEAESVEAAKNGEYVIETVVSSETLFSEVQSTWAEPAEA